MRAARGAGKPSGKRSVEVSSKCSVNVLSDDEESEEEVELTEDEEEMEEDESEYESEDEVGAQPYQLPDS